MWAPLSISLFAGGGGREPWPSGTVVDARGMVDISRCVPSEEVWGGCSVVVDDVVVLEEGEEENGERSQENIPPPLGLELGEGGAVCVWLISVEEQLAAVVREAGGLVLSLLIGVVGAKGVDLGPLFLSHAARVAWSTGQASAGAAEGIEGSLDIFERLCGRD